MFNNTFDTMDRGMFDRSKDTLRSSSSGAQEGGMQDHLRLKNDLAMNLQDNSMANNVQYEKLTNSPGSTYNLGLGNRNKPNYMAAFAAQNKYNSRYGNNSGAPKYNTSAMNTQTTSPTSPALGSGMPQYASNMNANPTQLGSSPTDAQNYWGTEQDSLFGRSLA